MATQQKIPQLVASLIELGKEQLTAGNEEKALDYFLESLQIAVKVLKLDEQVVEPLVQQIHKLLKKRYE